MSAVDSVDDFITDMGTVHAEKDMSPTMENFMRYTNTGGSLTYNPDNGVQINTNTTVGGNATIELQAYNYHLQQTHHFKLNSG